MSYYQGLLADSATFRANNGDQGEAYYARPSRAGKFSGIVIIHHLPGWDEWTMEVVRKFAHHGYEAVSPHFISAKTPVTRRPTILARACAPPAAWPTPRSWATSKARWIICARRPMPTAESASSDSALAAATPISPPARSKASMPRSIAGAAMLLSTIPRTSTTSARWRRSIARNFRQRRRQSDGRSSQSHRGRPQEARQELRIPRCNGAGHAFFNTWRDAYRPEQALDGWKKVFAFLNCYLAKSAASIAAE